MDQRTPFAARGAAKFGASWKIAMTVPLDDLMILADEVHRFDCEREIIGKPYGGKGPVSEFDWDEFWRAVAVRVHEKGVPPTIKEFTKDLSNWFLDQSDGKSCPSDDVIRKCLTALGQAAHR